MREALRAIRYARSLHDSPLLQLDLVSLHLRASGTADTPEGRSWALGRCLQQLVDERLAGLRGQAENRPPGADTVEDELCALRADLRATERARPALGLLHARFLSPHQPAVGMLADELGLAPRTVRNWVTRGVGMLVPALREAEAEAARERAALPPVASSAPIRLQERVDERPVPALLDELLAALREQRGLVRLSPEQLAALSDHPAADWVGYRLGRIARWSQPRYRVDERFVPLTLQVDLGEEDVSGRWRAREAQFASLRALLDETPDALLVLLGPPGSGKSTLLRRLEIELAREALHGEDERARGTPLTWLASLNQYRARVDGAPPPDPASWLAERWALRFPHLPPFESLLRQRPMLLLLDGLNEMPHRDARDYHTRVVAWKRTLEDLLAGGMGHRAVVTCRSLDYSAPLSSPRLRVRQARVQPLGDAEIEAFLARYAPRSADALWRELRGSRRLEALRWPYPLRLFVEAAEASPRVAPGLAALFTAHVRRALRRELARDNPLFALGEPGTSGALVDALDVRQALRDDAWRSAHALPARGTLFDQLARLAYGMQAAGPVYEPGQRSIDARGLRMLLADQDAERVVAAGLQLGILDRDPASDDVMFVHQLMQEHFAARRLAEQPKPALVRVEWRSERVEPPLAMLLATGESSEPLPALESTGWEETTRMAAALCAQPETFVRGVAAEHLVLAGEIAATAEVGTRLSEGLCEELRQSLIRRSRDPRADLRHRIACGLALGHLDDPRLEQDAGPHGDYLLPPMIGIPAGGYRVGSDEAIRWVVPGTDEWNVSRRHCPRHEVALMGFRIARFPVTNAEWACFIAAGGYEEERWWDTPDARRWRRGELGNASAIRNNRLWRRRFRDDPALLEQLVADGRIPNEAIAERWRRWLAMDDDAFEADLAETWQAKRETAPAYWGEPRFANPAQPVNGMSWYEARAYCRWLSAQTGRSFRLPTEVEWEAAAAGLEGRRFPWGDAQDGWHANDFEMRLRRTTPVGVFPEGDTPDGIVDLAGNVNEWTSSLFGAQGEDAGDPAFAFPYVADDGREDPEAPDSAPRVIRGGAFIDGRTNAFVHARGFALPDTRNTGSGLRLVEGEGPLRS